MNSLNRRNFLKGALGSAAAVSGFRMYNPASAIAQSTPGKNLILINAHGGMDGLASVPYVEGIVRDYLLTGVGATTALRPWLSYLPPGTTPAADARQVAAITSATINTAQNGLPNKIALNPAWAPLLATGAGQADVGANIKLLKGVGSLGIDNRSHETMQLYITMLDPNLSAATRRGWTARASDAANLPPFAFWGICNCGDLPFFNTTSSPRPIVLNSFGPMEYVDRSNIDAIGNSGGDDDSRYTRQLALELLAVEQGSTDIERSFRQGMQQVPITKNIVDQIETIPTVGSYVNRGGSFYTNCRDVARILSYKKNSVDLQNRPSIIYMQRGGFDTHESQANFNRDGGGVIQHQEGGLAQCIRDISENIAALIVDLKALSMFENTVIIIMSEFGRTTRQNSYINSVGTDHASGSNTLVIGGSVRGGVAGSDPTVADLIHPWNNSISPNIAFETPVGAALQWMGLNAVSIIPSYNSTTGNALQLFV